MELIDFKDRLERSANGNKVVFSSIEKTYLFGKHYELTGRTVNRNCSSCHPYAYKILLNHINLNKSPQEMYFQKYDKPVPNRYKNNTEWIQSKL